jgi:hypothetical protein
LISINLNVGISHSFNQKKTFNFKTPEELINSYIQTLSFIAHPMDLHEIDVHRENVLSHYVDKEFNTVLLKVLGIEFSKSEVAEKQRQTIEGALIVTENLLNRLSIDSIDLKRATIEFIEILLQNEEKLHPDIDFARGIVTLNHQGTINLLTFVGLTKFEGHWYFTEGPIGWNEDVLSSWLSGLKEENIDLHSIEWESFEEESNEVDDWKEKVLLTNIYSDWILRGKFRNVKCDTLYYTDKIDAHIIDSTIKRIAGSRNFRIDHYMSSPDEILVLSETERSFLINELEKLKTHKWDSDMFPQSKMVTLNEVKKVFKIVRKLKTTSEVNMCSIIYTFSNPIKIRSGELALYLYQERYRENYTQLKFSFYIKISDNWEEYASVYDYYDH